MSISGYRCIQCCWGLWGTCGPASCTCHRYIFDAELRLWTNRQRFEMSIQLSFSSRGVQQPRGAVRGVAESHSCLGPKKTAFNFWGQKALTWPRLLCKSGSVLGSWCSNYRSWLQFQTGPTRCTSKPGQGKSLDLHIAVPHSLLDQWISFGFFYIIELN